MSPNQTFATGGDRGRRNKLVFNYVQMKSWALCHWLPTNYTLNNERETSHESDSTLVIVNSVC